VPTC